jgi:EAL domain-containing protein (putative c-di-GMP-specific phosphodiesterase class I)
LQAPVIRPTNTVDHLLLAAPEAFVLRKIAALLGSVAPAADEVALKLACGGRDWRRDLKQLAQQLSAPQRRDVRVAVVERNADDRALQGAMLAARSLEQFIVELDHEWLLDILARDALGVHVQPIVQVSSDRAHGYECLLRGVIGNVVVPPTKLFDAARMLNCLPLLDRRARLRCISQVAPLIAKQGHLHCFINFDPAAIYDPAECFASSIEAIASAGLQPGQVVFEIVDAQPWRDRRDLTAIAQFLRSGGFKIALDDIGPAFLATPWLAELRPDYIKIEPSHVRSAPHNGLDAKVVRDLSEAARRRGIAAIAKGIETEAELRFVTNAGVALTQGQLHADPASVQAIAAARHVKVA